MVTNNDLDQIQQIFKRKKKIKAKGKYTLTALGKNKAEEYKLQGVRWKIIAILDVNGGPMSATEIANEAGMNPEKVKHILNGLESDQYVQRINIDD